MVSKKNLTYIAIGVLVLFAYKMYGKKKKTETSENSSLEAPTKPYGCKERLERAKNKAMTTRFVSNEAREEMYKTTLGEECYKLYKEGKL